ncbi:hypothetical protein JCM1840_000745 [Sporobolomyces johnsonii]
MEPGPIGFGGALVGSQLNAGGVPPAPGPNPTSPSSTSSSTSTTTRGNARTDRPPRPANAWLLFRIAQLRQIQDNNPGMRRSQGEMSKIIAEMWRNADPETKREYEGLAKQRKLEHQRAYPDYRYAPNPKPSGSGKAPKIGRSSSSAALRSPSTQSHSPPSQSSSSTARRTPTTLDLPTPPFRAPPPSNNHEYGTSSSTDTASAHHSAFVSTEPHPMYSPAPHWTSPPSALPTFTHGDQPSSHSQDGLVFPPMQYERMPASAPPSMTTFGQTASYGLQLYSPRLAEQVHRPASTAGSGSPSASTFSASSSTFSPSSATFSPSSATFSPSSSTFSPSTSTFGGAYPSSAEPQPQPHYASPPLLTTVGPPAPAPTPFGVSPQETGAPQTAQYAAVPPPASGKREWEGPRSSSSSSFSSSSSVSSPYRPHALQQTYYYPHPHPHPESQPPLPPGPGPSSEQQPQPCAWWWSTSTLAAEAVPIERQQQQHAAPSQHVAGVLEPGEYYAHHHHPHQHHQYQHYQQQQETPSQSHSHSHLNSNSDPAAGDNHNHA